MPNTIDEIRKEFTREVTLREYEARKQQEQLMNMSASPRYTTFDITAIASSASTWRTFGPIYAELAQLGFVVEVFENE